MLWSPGLRQCSVAMWYYTNVSKGHGSSMAHRNIDHYTASHPVHPQGGEDGDSVVFRNFGIVPHYCTASQPVRFQSEEDGGSIALRNVGILPHHCATSHPSRLRHEWV
jgi:hypothetical protein